MPCRALMCRVCVCVTFARPPGSRQLSTLPVSVCAVLYARAGYARPGEPSPLLASSLSGSAPLAAFETRCKLFCHFWFISRLVYGSSTAVKAASFIATVFNTLFGAYPDLFSSFGFVRVLMGAYAALTTLRLISPIG